MKTLKQRFEDIYHILFGNIFKTRHKDEVTKKYLKATEEWLKQKLKPKIIEADKYGYYNVPIKDLAEELLEELEEK